MKKPEKQILAALKRAVRDRGMDIDVRRSFRYLKEICEAPYQSLIIKAHPEFKFKGYDANFSVSINIALDNLGPLFEPANKESRMEAILMEIAHKLYLHAEEYYKKPLVSFLYDDKVPQLDLSEFELNLDYAVSFTKIYDDKKDCAIFHIEQECGCSWLILVYDRYR